MTGERFSFLKGMPILKIPIWRACMISILFVCHGNICRSPMAEFVMKKLVNDAGKADEFYIESAATSTEEPACSKNAFETWDSPGWQNGSPIDSQRFYDF